MEGAVAKGADNLAKYVWKSPKILLTIAMVGTIVYIIQRHKETIAKLDALLADRGLLPQASENHDPG